MSCKSYDKVVNKTFIACCVIELSKSWRNRWLFIDDHKNIIIRPKYSICLLYQIVYIEKLRLGDCVIQNTRDFSNKKPFLLVQLKQKTCKRNINITWYTKNLNAEIKLLPRKTASSYKGRGNIIMYEIHLDISSMPAVCPYQSSNT